MTLGELFTGLGYVAGAAVFWWAASQRKLLTPGMAWVIVIGLAFAVLGARFTELVAEGWPFRIPAVVALDPRAGGKALLGGLLFGWIGVEVAKRRLGIRRSTGDLFALALPAGEAVGRIGCFFNGCCYGERCDLPWAVFQHGAMRHPAQLYSAVVALSLFCVLVGVRKRLSGEGDLFLVYLAAFGITRFLLEFVRWRESVVFGLSPMQWFCVELTVGVAVWAYLRRHRRRPVEGV